MSYISRGVNFFVQGVNAYFQEGELISPGGMNLHVQG